MNSTCATFRRFHRRHLMRIGGSTLCGVSLLDLLRSGSRAADGSSSKAKQVICCWMGGGPPHTDMFDMKPESPVDYRGEFKPIASTLHGLDVCELLPSLAKLADKYTVIRSITTMNKPGDHSRAPYYWQTGNPRLPSGTLEYPTYGSVISKLAPGPADLPSYAVLGSMDAHVSNGPASSFLGPAHRPFIFDPTESKDAISKMLTPQIELPALARNVDLLKALDQRFRAQDRLDPVIQGLDQYQQTAFNMLRSPRLREALDLSKEDPKTIERYSRNDPQDRPTYGRDGKSMHFLLARRLIEAGVPIVHFNIGYWDWHSKNFVTARRMFPQFDACLSSLLEDLDERGLLDSTIVLALGEMGRKPKCGTKEGAGRDHWDYAQFVLAAGGGFRRGTIVGATDKLGEQVTDNFYKVESFGATLYHLLGIDPHTRLTTESNRPVDLIAEQAPIITEAIV